MSKMNSHRIALAAAVLLCSAAVYGVYAVTSKTSAPAYDRVAVRRGDLTETLSFTGRVKAGTDVDLAFERGGKTSAVNVAVGDRVKAGQVLATLAADDLAAQWLQSAAAVQAAQSALAQGQAGLERERVRLQDIKNGARPEEIAMLETKADGARTALEDARRTLADRFADAVAKCDDAIRGKADAVFLNPRSSVPQLSIYIGDSQRKTDLEWQRLNLESALTALAAGEQGASDVDGTIAAASRAQKLVSDSKSFLDSLATALDTTSVASNPNLTQAALDGYRLSVSAGRSAVAAASSNLVGGLEKISGAQVALTLAEQQLALGRAGGAAAQVAVQEAVVAGQEAVVSGQEAQVKLAEAAQAAVAASLAKTRLVAPIDGVVSRVSLTKGEMAAPNAAVISVISADRYEIEAAVAEADVAKVQSGDAAAVTLDAYGQDDSFAAEVAHVDPAETQINGAAAYRTVLRFSTEDARIKSGMTANVALTVGTAKDALLIPRSAVVLRDGQPHVLLLNDRQPEQRAVTLGLHDSAGHVEVLSGLEAGDEVADFGLAQ